MVSAYTYTIIRKKIQEVPTIELLCKMNVLLAVMAMCLDFRQFLMYVNCLRSRRRSAQVAAGARGRHGGAARAAGHCYT